MSHFSSVYSAQTSGINAHIINVETDITKKTLQAFSVVGLPDKAVEESRDRVSAAIKNTGFTSPKNINYKTIISLAPADIKKEGPVFDLAMALGYLLADSKINFEPKDKIFLGELSLDGKLRPIKGALILVREAKRSGYKEVYLPKENTAEGALIDGIKIFGVNSLEEAIAHINTKKDEANEHIIPQRIDFEKQTEIKLENKVSDIDFSDIRGQESAKRGLEIAAAGGHNIAMYGPPGTGKTLLAKAFSGILPALSFEEMLEVTGIHSVSGFLKNEIITSRPFRSPHHTSSHTAIIGGGTFPKPGEITLAHKGVLFFDEFPEFDRRVIEALRQPLEEGSVSISRTKSSEIFPAQFILIAAMNPCPCGYFGTNTKRCICTPSLMQKYKRKLSGPIMDRIDIWVSVENIDHEKLSSKNDDGNESRNILDKIIKARALQKDRFIQTNIDINGSMSVKDIDKYINLDEKTKKQLNASAKSLGLSARAYHRTIKLSRTIADLDGSEEIKENHIFEAIQYRPRLE